MKNKNLDDLIKDDPLIQGLLAAKDKKVHVIAFGLAYVGNLTEINLDHGYIRVVDKEDRVTLELERVESFELIEGQ